MPKMIVIEGLDGSGKATQTAKLIEALRGKGLGVKFLGTDPTPIWKAGLGPSEKSEQ